MGQELAEQAKSEELGSQHDQQHGEHQERTCANLLMLHYPFEGQVETDQHADESRKQPRYAKQVHWTLTVLGQEVDRKEIEETLGQARPAVFRLAPGAGVMLDRNFGNAEALGIGQHWR